MSSLYRLVLILLAAGAAAAETPPLVHAARSQQWDEVAALIAARTVDVNEAQADGNTVRWARLIEEGRALIEEAVRLAG